MPRYLLCAFLLLLPARLIAQMPSGNFTSHTNGQTVTSASVVITWKGCSNATQSSYQTRVNGVGLVTTQSNTFPCPDYLIGRNYSAPATLAAGANVLYLSVCDVSGCGDSVITVYLSVPSVSVTPDGATAPSITLGTATSYAFKVRNTGANSATATFSYSCTGELNACSVAPSSASIPVDDSATVTFSYTGAAVGVGQAKLTATYNEYPGVTDSGWVNVQVLPDPQLPSGSFTSHTDGQTVASAAITITWKGCSNATQSSYETRLNGVGLSTTQSSTIPCPDYQIGRNYSASGTLVSGPNTLYLNVCDIAGCGNKTITVHYNPSAMSVTVVPVNPSQAVTPGNATIRFDITNTSQGTSTPSTFALTPTVAGSVTSCSMSPASVTLTPGAPSIRVDANCSISTAGSSGSVKVTASTTSPSSFSGEGTTNVTIAPVYRIVISPATGSATVSPGSANTHSVVIQNTSTNAVNPITVSLPSPSCSGVTIGGCSVAANSAAISQGSQTSSITLSYNALAGGAETVTLVPSGTVSGGTVQVTNGVLNVTVSSSSQTIVVAVAGKNPGTTIDKASCLIVAAGQNAAYECGDLRVVHPFPATATMDRAQAPALIYNSRHANPGGWLAADVNYSGSTATLLRASVTVPGQSTTTRDFAWNAACFNKACRIVVPVSTTQPTGLYPATLQVSAMNGSTVLTTSTPVTDTVIVVNRTASPYGVGWWLDGLESLVTVSSTKMLWMGGDGSTRLYSSATDPTVYTVTPAYDRPDTLKRVLGPPDTWRRLMGDSAYVVFNSAGQHIETVNALGWKTSFAHTGAVVDSITLPVPAGSASVRRYRLRYTSALLDSVQAPTASLSRTVRIARGGTSRINTITDPDGLATAFGYDASNRITTRRNKLNDTTYFQYDDGGALRESRLSTARTDGAGSAITTMFRAAETRSVFDISDLPTLPASVFTRIDGPRTDVGDTTNIIVNRWGAPDSVTNAVGQRTRVTRSSIAFPALATKVVGANGLETQAFFNSRGLPDSTVAVDPFNTGANATTRYLWNPVWNQPDSVIRPMGERTRTFYRTTRPIVDSMRMGSNVARRVKFAYTGDNQVRSVTEPGLLPDSVTYDALGNASRTWTPMGRAAATPYFTEFLKDAIGRDTLVLQPISGDTTNSTRVMYDVADRVSKIESHGPPRPYSLPLNPSFAPDTAVVDTLVKTDSSAYDAEGNVVFKRGVSSVGDVQFNENLTYDAAGRLRKRLVGTGPDSMVYDPAGNLVSARHRSLAWVTQSYDPLNRLITRVVPEIIYPRLRCGGFAAGPISGVGSSCLMVFPYYPNSGDNLRIPADTARFVYDSFGNMTQANNLYARVRRTYYRGGALKTDTIRIGSNSNPLADAAAFGQQYTYDLSGRRTLMQWPAGPTSYTYNDFGGLSTVTSLGGIQHRFVYTLAGQVDSLLQGTGVREKRSYDGEGRRVSRRRVSDFGTMGVLVHDSLSYDKMSRITRAWQEVYQQSPDQTLISYDGLGAVVAKEQGNQFGSSVEEFRNDALGNVLRRLTRRTAGLINNAPFAMSYGFIGQLNSVVAQLKSPPEGIYQREDDLTQLTERGRMVRQGQIVRNPNDGTVELQVAARHYFGADDRLMAVQRYSWRGPSFRDGTWEEYRYDALGRRVVTRARRDPAPIHPATLSGPLCQSTTFPICRSFTERVWWDGDTDQALVESRIPEGTADVSNDDIVGNIHGLTLDEPLGVISYRTNNETRIINYNWRGQGLSSVYQNGQGADASTGNAVAEVDWPAMTQAQTYFTPAPELNPNNNPKKWLGTFVQNGIGTTGMLYGRNRYFDTKSGRFTQEDPTGIATGLNVYGFAEGDPINFSDPFGLCPYFLTGRPCSTGVAIGIGFIPLGGDAVEIAGAVLGRDLLTGESLSGLAVGATIAGTLVGSGKLAREGAELAVAAQKWGRNRLVKELHHQGFVLDRPTRSGGGMLYRNADTREEIRIMPRPAQRFRNDPAAKHESDHYYRYRSGPDQPWGPHTSIPDR